MTLRKLKLKTILLIAAAVAATGAQAQLRLPAAHSGQHNMLLADQRPATSSFKVENNNRLLQDLQKREAEVETDIYDSHWNSERVNPYSGSVVPDHKNIDVSEFHMPLKKGHITSNYGYRSSFGRMHYGTDLRLSIGDTVRAAFSGKVRITKYEGRGYGYYVVVRHDNGMETVYGHLSRFLVKPDQYVRAGQPIALGGNTGRSTGPHLHFETRFMGVPINPASIIDFEGGQVRHDTFAFDKSRSGKPSYQPTNQAKRRSYAAKSKAAKKRAAAKKSRRRR